MPFIIAFAALLAFQLAGEVLVHLFAIPLPGPLAGMLLLFIPAVSGVMLSFGQLKQEWLPFIAAGVFGTIITQMVTAFCLSWLLKRRRSNVS